VCVYGTTVWELVQNYATKHRPSTPQTCEPLPIISVKYSSILPDDGSHTIRNMLQ